MSEVYVALAERIRVQMPDLERLVSRATSAWRRAREEREELYVDSMALSLHSLYSGLERLFELVARHVDGQVPDEETWHRTLLPQVAADVPAGDRP